MGFSYGENVSLKIDLRKSFYENLVNVGSSPTNFD